MSFREKIQDMMRRSGKTYHQCCAELGRRGGQVAAAKRRRASQEIKRQEATKIR